MAEALVILSGGQDSTTALFWAKQRFGGVHAVTYEYGQRHGIELEAAATVASIAGVKSHNFVKLGPVLVGSSPLVNAAAAVGHYESPEKLPGGIEPTFVPGRNLLFLTLAMNLAASLNIAHLVMGVCQIDYGGYPDCRREFIDAARLALSEALTGKPDSLEIHTPLISLSKKETVLLAKSLPGCWEALAYTHTCYDGKYPPHPSNHASLLRAKGFREAGEPDPLILRAKKEGLLPESYPDDGYVVVANED